jgi:hypothetical protein
MDNTENQDTRTPMNQDELKDLLSYLRECFLDGDTDTDIVLDIFGSYGAWREDLVALIRLMVKQMSLKSGAQVHIDTDDAQWGRVASDGIVLDVFSDDRYLVHVQSIRADIIVPEQDIKLK